MDWSTFLSGIAAILAGLAAYSAHTVPEKIEKLRLKHEEKMYEQKFINENEANIIEDYIKHTGALVEHFSDHNYTTYLSVYGNMLIYPEDKIRKDVSDLHKLLAYIRGNTSFVYTGGKTTDLSLQRKESKELFAKICENLANSKPRKIVNPEKEPKENYE